MRSFAVTEFGQPLEAIEGPRPEPKGTEVLLQVRRCGVCHTDVHLAHGYYDLGSAGKVRMAERGVALPLVLGHEVLGEVAALGPDADGPPLGATRLVYPWIGCGTCHACRSGRDNMCQKPSSIGVFRPGGYAEYVLVSHPRFLLDIGDLDPGVAATYACSGLTAYSAAMKVLPLAEGAWVVVIGAGGLGLNALAILRALKVERIAVVDIDAAKLEAARRAGADLVIDSAASGAVEELRQATGNRAEAVLDFVAATATARFALDLLPKGGSYIAVGLHGGDVTLGLPLLVLRALRVEGSLQGTLGELEALIALAQGNGVAPLPVSLIPLAQAPEALRRLEEGKVVGRLVLTG